MAADQPGRQTLGLTGLAGRFFDIALVVGQNWFAISISDCDPAFAFPDIHAEAWQVTDKILQ